MAGGRLNFIDTVQITSDGGKDGLGYLYAERTIDPSDWFFQFHFHQDPVMPGSLGFCIMGQRLNFSSKVNRLGEP